MDSKLVFLTPPENFNPRLEVAACFLAVEEKFLFMKRQPHRTEGSMWGIPGGKCEKGESAERAVMREIKEETGIDLSEQPLESIGKVYIRYPEVDFIYHMFGHVMAEIPSIVFDVEEHSEYQWITLREALQLPLIRGEEECILLFTQALKR